MTNLGHIAESGENSGSWLKASSAAGLGVFPWFALWFCDLGVAFSGQSPNATLLRRESLDPV